METTLDSKNIFKKQNITYIEFLKMCESHDLRIKHLRFNVTPINGEEINLSNIVLDNTSFYDLPYNLTSISINNSELNNVYFNSSRLIDAKFKNCNLTKINFSACDLSRSFFNNCKLNHSDFGFTNLRNSVFNNCTLEGSNLLDTTLNNVTFNNCNLRDVRFPSPFELLKIRWDNLSSELTAICQAVDCYYHGNVGKFEKWSKKGYPCPYSNSIFQRVLNFSETPKDWNPSLTKEKFNIYDLLRRLFAEKNCTVNF